MESSGTSARFFIRKCPQINANTIVFWIGMITSFILASTQIFSGEVCVTSMQKTPTAAIQYKEACIVDDTTVAHGLPSLKFSSATPVAASELQEAQTYAATINVTGGWPGLNSLVHIVAPLISILIVLGMAHLKSLDAEVCGWLLIACFYGIALFVDAYTLSKWKQYCVPETPTVAVSLLLQSLDDTTQAQIGQTNFLTAVHCRTGWYVSLVLLLTVACIAAVVNAAIIKLTDKIDKDDMQQALLQAEEQNDHEYTKL